MSRFESLAQQRQFLAVAHATDPLRSWVTWLPVLSRIDVAATREQQSDGSVKWGGVFGVDPPRDIERFGKDLVLGLVERREDARVSTGPLDLSGVKDRDPAGAFDALAGDRDPAVRALATTPFSRGIQVP